MRRGFAGKVLKCILALMATGMGLQVGLQRAEAAENGTDVPAERQTIATDKLIAVVSADCESISCYSAAAGDEWKKYVPPTKAKLLPIVAGGVLGLRIEGAEIRELAAYSAEQGKWTEVTLPTPAKGVAEPILGEDVVLYEIGDSCYAYGAKSGAWDRLAIPAGEAHTSRIESVGVVVNTKSFVAVFSRGSEKWAVLKQ